MLQPINRLPPEILSHVARCSFYKEDKNALPLVPLTHVCRYWRESIISNPENWALISDRNEDMAATSLERAKAAPLQISLSMKMVKKCPRFPNIITPHFQNVESFTVFLDPSFKDFTETFPTFPQSMPNLRSLSLTLYGGWELSVDPFKGITHTLTCLSLYTVPLTPSLLKLRTLTNLTLHYSPFNLPLDTLLNFLEQNRSLRSASLRVDFVKPSLRRSRRRAPMENRLEYLQVDGHDALDARALISNIPLQKGAHLDIFYDFKELDNVFSGISTTHLSNLLSPNLMEYDTDPRHVQLYGPNGIFTLSYALLSPFTNFVEFPLLPLANIQEFRLTHRRNFWTTRFNPIVFNPSSFPALKTIVIGLDTSMSRFFSALFSNPSSSPSLKTLVFLNCDLPEDFMKELRRFASDRMKTTSARLHSVLIVHKDGKFPSAASIHRLRSRVKAVDIRVDVKLPRGLIRRGVRGFGSPTSGS